MSSRPGAPKAHLAAYARERREERCREAVVVGPRQGQSHVVPEKEDAVPVRRRLRGVEAALHGQWNRAPLATASGTSGRVGRAKVWRGVHAGGARRCRRGPSARPWSGRARRPDGTREAAAGSHPRGRAATPMARPTPVRAGPHARAEWRTVSADTQEPCSVHTLSRCITCVMLIRSWRRRTTYSSAAECIEGAAGVGRARLRQRAQG